METGGTSEGGAAVHDRMCARVDTARSPTHSVSPSKACAPRTSCPGANG